MPIYGQTLSKQGGGVKWLTIHKIKNPPTNCAQCTCSIVLYSVVYTNEEKGSCSKPMFHEENHINIACFTTSRGKATKNMGIYKISGSSKRKATGQNNDDKLHKNIRRRLVAHEMNSIHFSHSTYKILHLLFQQPSSI